MNIFILHASDMLTDHRPHGDGLVAFGFIRSLAARGHELHVAVHHSDLQHPLPANVHLYPIHTQAPKGPRQRLQYMLAIRKLLHSLRSRIEIHVVHQLNPVFTGLSLAVVGSGLPLVLGPYVGGWPRDIHEIAGERTKHNPLLSTAKSALSFLQQSFADALLVTTSDARRRIPLAPLRRSAIHELPHGIDPDLFTPRPGWDRLETSDTDQPAPSVLFYAHIWRGKALDVLLQAFDSVADAIPHVVLKIAGGGRDRDVLPLKTRASLLRHADQITFLGPCSRTQAIDLFRNASVYCLPSRGEPFGMTALEAMSCGKPLVVTAAGGLQYLVQQEGGRTVPVDNPALLAAALISLLQSPELCLSMGRFNRALVERRFSWPILAGQLEAIYSKVSRTRLGTASSV